MDNQLPIISRLNPEVLLVLSRALQALRPSLIAVLGANAEVLSGGISPPISFCNVLFVGNFCAALTVLGWFGIGPVFRDFYQKP